MQHLVSAAFAPFSVQRRRAWSQSRLLSSNWTRAAVYTIGLVPAVRGFVLGALNELGADPVQSFEHLLGLWALRFLIATLLISPLRTLLAVNLLRFRRVLGLLAFWYAAMHVATYAVLDQHLDLPVILGDVTKRPFIIIGLITFLLLLVLALTSNRASMRGLGRNWARLHRLTYLAIALGAVHFLMSVKSWPPQPVVYAAIVAVVLGGRLAAWIRPLARWAVTWHRPARTRFR